MILAFFIANAAQIPSVYAHDYTTQQVVSGDRRVFLNGDTITITTDAPGISGGVDARGGANVTIPGVDIDMARTAGDDRGVHVTDSTVNISDSTVTTASLFASAVLVQGSSDVTISRSRLTTTATGGTYGLDNGSGGVVVVDYDGKASNVNISNTTISTAAYQAAGVAGLTGGSVIIIYSSDITTTGRKASAVATDFGSRLTMTGGSVHTSGQEGWAVLSSGQYSGATNPGYITVDSVDISASGDIGMGIVATYGATADVKNSAISTSGVNGRGVYAVSEAIVSVDKTSVTTTGSLGYGMMAAYASDIYASDVSVITSADNTYAFVAAIDSFAVMTGGSLVTGGRNSAGAFAQSGSYIALTSADITTSGTGAHGVSVYANSSADVTDSVILISADGAYGVSVYNNSSASVSDSKITTAGEFGRGVDASVNSSADITGAAISTRGDYGFGVSAADNSSVIVANSDINTAGGEYAYSYGVYASDNSSADIRGSNITTSGGYSHGVYVEAGSSADVTDSVITANGANSAAFSMGDDAAGWDGNVINVTATTAGAAGSATELLTAFGDNTFNADSSALTGDISHSKIGGAESALEVSLRNHTVFTGAMYSPAINVHIDSSSAWNVTKDSTPNGTLNNAGTMNFGVNASDGFKQVRVSDYNGDAATSRLNMKTDINTADRTDQIYATNRATGGSGVTVYNTANSGAERSMALLLADGGGGSVLTLANYDEETDGVRYIHAGAWKYSLARGSVGAGGEEWYLLRGDKLPEPEPDPDPEPRPDDGLTTTGLAIAAGAFLHDVWYTETNTWNNRMGIYRDGLWNGGFWISAAADREDFNQVRDDTIADHQNFKTGTIGFDKRYDVGGGELWVGVMVGYGKTESGLTAGIGDVDMDSSHASVYGVYRASGGLYVNGIVKYNRYNSELTITKPDNFSRYVLGLDRIKGEWGQDGLGISVQAGKRFGFDRDNGKNGWYWEPQAQLSWNRVFGTDYRTDSGIAVEIDDADYVRIRGGVVLGKNWTLENGTQLDLYADASIIHDFDADTKVTMDKGVYESTLGGTWGVYGVGANWRFAPGRFLHARLQYSDGAPFSEPFAVYLGLSFETN